MAAALSFSTVGCRGRYEAAVGTAGLLLLIPLLAFAGAGATAPAARLLNRGSPLNQADQHRGNGQDQQDVDESTQSVGCRHSEKPHNEQNDKNGPKHCFLLSFGCQSGLKLQSPDQILPSQ